MSEMPEHSSVLLNNVHTFWEASLCNVSYQSTTPYYHLQRNCSPSHHPCLQCQHPNHPLHQYRVPPNPFSHPTRCHLLNTVPSHPQDQLTRQYRELSSAQQRV